MKPWLEGYEVAAGEGSAHRHLFIGEVAICGRLKGGEVPEDAAVCSTCNTAARRLHILEGPRVNNCTHCGAPFETRRNQHCTRSCYLNSVRVHKRIKRKA